MALPWKFSIRVVTTVCVVVILLAGDACRHSEAKFKEKDIRTVAITNSLGNGSNLTVHCSQRGIDLGEHTIGANEQYVFSFKINVVVTQVYFCTFSWKGACHWFDIFDMSRDYNICNYCSWQIKSDGPCRHGQSDAASDGCVRWNKGS